MIREVVERFVVTDPVRGTRLGTVLRFLSEGAWAAFDDDRLAVRTRSGSPLQIVGTWSPAQRAELADLLGGTPPAGLTGTEDEVRPFAEMLHPGPVTLEGQQLMRCDELIRPAGIAGSASTAHASQHELVTEWFVRFTDEAGGAGPPPNAVERELAESTCHLWLDGSGLPVSMAVRQPPAAGCARIGPVYTPPAHRGHGYASAVTATATADVLRDGNVPVLFTDHANATASQIYRALGYRWVEDRVMVTF